MPFGVKPVCSVCKTDTSTMWRKSEKGEVLCNSCGLKALNGGKDPSQSAVSTVSIPQPPENNGKTAVLSSTNNNEKQNEKDNKAALRKSTRIRPTKSRPQNSSKSLATKGKNRRVVFKRNPIKSVAAVATVVTTDYVFHDGMYWQVGDIVSLIDVDGGIYFAQIRGLLQDQFCQKSAVITWLLPTQATVIGEFDPATYILGPEEDLPRTLDCMEFVCHAPSDYYKAKNTPYPTVNSKPELGFIWTSIGPEIRKLPTTDEIFGTVEMTEDTNVTVKTET